MEGERRGKGGAAERLRKPSGVPFWHKTPVSPTLSILNRCLGIPLSLSLPVPLLRGTSAADLAYLAHFTLQCFDLKNGSQRKDAKKQRRKGQGDGEWKTAINSFTQRVKVHGSKNPCVLAPLRLCVDFAALFRLTLRRPDAPSPPSRDHRRLIDIAGANCDYGLKIRR